MSDQRDSAAVVAIVSAASRRFGHFVCALESAFPRESPAEIIVSRSSQETTRAANEAAQRAALVIAVGGDGTVADVATGIFGSNAILGIVPTGSTNIVARGLGIPANPLAAIQLVAAGPAVKTIDVGRCAGRSFLHMAGAGFDAEIFRGTQPSLKRAVGWLAYLPAAFGALRIAPSSLEITVDGSVTKTRSPLVLVANGGSVVTPGFELLPEIANDDGSFDVIVFSPRTPVQKLSTLGLIGIRALHRSPHVLRLRGRQVQVEADPPLPYQLDGDVRGTTPVTFSLAKHAMGVAVPAS